MGFTAPVGMNMPRRRKEQSRRGGGNIFEVALVFLALNGNTIIFAALHFPRKLHKALRLLDICYGWIRYRR